MLAVGCYNGKRMTKVGQGSSSGSTIHPDFLEGASIEFHLLEVPR